jgi:hypothetical protein
MNLLQSRVLLIQLLCLVLGKFPCLVFGISQFRIYLNQQQMDIDQF